MWGNKQIMKVIKKNILTSLLLLLVLFLVENRTYLFTYLPHRYVYEQREAYIQYGHSRNSYVEVAVMEQGEAIGKATVKRALGDKFGVKITVGYAPGRKPSVVRTSPVVTGRQIFVLAMFILSNLQLIWKLYKAAG